MYKIYFSYFFYILNYYHITSLPQQIFFSKICLPDCSISKIRRATWRQFGDRVYGTKSLRKNYNIGKKCIINIGIKVF